MHGVIPYRPAEPPANAAEELLPRVAFAVLPVLIVLIASAIVARGLPTKASAKTMSEMVAETPGM